MLNELIEDKNIADHAEKAYLEYAMSVVVGRALPHVADGLKPVHRRILYAMNELGLLNASKPVKSAKIVGTVLGSYHPHGDSACYEAMVRLAQPFSLRYPLVHGQGNFGSRDGDGAAAARYTEAKLATVSSLYLSEIKEDTVDFRPNYDNSTKEPSLLPARLPFVLLNGASGIAVGMACEIPSHNMREVGTAAIELIKNESCSLDTILGIVKGPDFPDGGQVISNATSIKSVYETGRGSFRMRAVWEIENMARNQWKLVIKELPYGVNAKKVLEEIEELTNPQVKEGKKSLTQDQLTIKQLFLGLIDSIRDESGKDVAIRIVIEPKTSKITKEDLLSALFGYTSLECNVPVNMTMIGLDGLPEQKGLLKVLIEWVASRRTAVRRRTEFRLRQTEARIHILQGRLTVFLNLDEVIKIIRESEDPKDELMKVFSLTEIQAEDILEIRLRQLAKLEGIKIEKELALLEKEKDKLIKLLTVKKAMDNLIIKEIESDLETYGDDRRTLIKEEAPAVVSKTTMVPDEAITVIVSKNGWIRAKAGHGLDVTTLTFKPGDSLSKILEVRTKTPLIGMDSNGKVYSVLGSEIPSGRGDGVPLTSMIDLQEGSKFLYFFDGTPSLKYLVAGSKGYGFIVKASDLVTRVKAGKVFLTLENNEQPLCPVLIENPGSSIVLQTTEGRVLSYALSEVKELPKGKGVKLIGLPASEAIENLVLAQDTFEVSYTKNNNADTQTCQLKCEDFKAGRGSKGKLITSIKKATNIKVEG